MKITINGIEYEAFASQTILDVAKRNDVDIPTLCYHPDLEPEARCRLCVVDADGKLETACNTKVKEGMVVVTENQEIRDARKLNMELLLANHGHTLDEDNELVRLARGLGVEKIRGEPLPEKSLDSSCFSLYRDNNKCVLCGKCVQKCQAVQGVEAIGYVGRGYHTEVAPPLDHKLSEVACVNCGQCAAVCPAGAIIEKDDTAKVLKALASSKKVVVQTAPSVRVSVGETQGLEPGTVSTGKLVAALRRLGFDAVLDTNFAADPTIVEEAHELIHRIQNNGVLPMMTSCCPGWVKYVEHFYPMLLPHVSTCKSPQQMFGALSKTYLSQARGWDSKEVVSVSIMPCTAKKYELSRPEMRDSGQQDVDFVLTTRELGRMLTHKNINLVDLPDERYDDLMGASTGAAAIFGATGGVMEAALRTAADTLTGQSLGEFEYHEVRGLEGVKDASVEVAGLTVNVAVAHSLSQAKKLVESLEDKNYHFIEVMACPGGCVGGGGQPLPMDFEKITQRTKGVYDVDQLLVIRKSHENPDIKKLYDDYLDHPGSEKAHRLLHTTYTERSKYPS